MPQVLKLLANSLLQALLKQGNKASMDKLKKEAFAFTDDDYKMESSKNEKDKYSFYYRYDSTKKLSYIGFDTFRVDYDGWDNYYKAIAKGETGKLPTYADSFLFVRNSLYKALEDGAEKVVLDISTNGGGSCAIMLGVMPNGAYYIRSSFNSLSNQNGLNIDSGVEDDKDMLGEPIESANNFKLNNYSNFYNLEYVNDVLNELFKSA